MVEKGEKPPGSGVHSPTERHPPGEEKLETGSLSRAVLVARNGAPTVVSDNCVNITDPAERLLDRAYSAPGCAARSKRHHGRT